MSKESKIDLQSQLLKLIDAYAESHATKGSALYNIDTFNKRQQLDNILGELVKSPERSVLTFIKGAVMQMEKEIEQNEKHLSNFI